MRFQRLSHKIIILRSYITSFNEIERTNYELREIMLITSRRKIVLRAIAIIITYNEYPSTENLYTEFYCYRVHQLRITRKCTNYVQG
jgi:hypothetical protein